MTSDQPTSVTSILKGLASGDESNLDRLLRCVYDDLHAIAARHMRGEPRGHTLQPTALVHEAYLRLVDQRAVAWQDRAHFFAVASRVIRRILVDHARARNALKRGGGAVATVEAVDAILPDTGVDMIALDDALARLAAMNERHAEIVEMRFFGGLSIDEVAEVLGVSARTVDREWSYARAWLYRELEGDGA